MKKIFNKITSAALAVLMSASVFTVAPITASAQTLTSGDFEYEISDGTARITGYNGSATKLTLPSSLGGYAVTELGYKAFNGNKTITTITIPKTIVDGGSVNGQVFTNTNIKTAVFENGSTLVANNIFDGCTTLTSVTIPDTVKVIEDRAFQNCTSLKNIELPSRLEEINYRAFKGCTGLTEITIPKTITAGGEEAFANTSIKKAIIENGAKKVPYDLFRGCATLESVSIPHTVTYIGSYAFYGCQALKNIELPMGLATISDYAFYSTGITEITIPKNVDSIGTKAIGYNKDGKVSGFVIKGYADTRAEKYAKDKDFKFVTLTKPQVSGIIGDTNLDGVLDVSDVTYLQMHLAGYKNSNGTVMINTSDNNVFMVADANSDGILDVADATYIQMMIAGVIK